MKSIVLILAAYLVFLSILPCGDGGGGIGYLLDNWLGTESFEHSDHEEHSNSCNDDSCSPLCGCNCCSITLNLAKSRPLMAKGILPDQRVITPYSRNLIGNPNTSSIWRPPKFC